MTRFINKILIIMGLLLILISIATGICIVILSFKFMGGGLTFSKYISNVLKFAGGGMLIAASGIRLIKFTTNTDDKEG